MGARQAAPLPPSCISPLLPVGDALGGNASGGPEFAYGGGGGGGGHGLGGFGDAEELFDLRLVGAVDGGQGGAEAEGAGGEQEVLDGGEDVGAGRCDGGDAARIEGDHDEARYTRGGVGE